MILLIDNYDSFTYNLAHLFEALGCEVKVVRNDAIDAEMAADLVPSHVVISPGPGRPRDAGASVEIVRRLAPNVPTLGVCLGHQVIVEAFGGEVGPAKRLVHGLALCAERDQEPRDLGGRGLAAHDRAHHLVRLLTREIVAVEQPRQCPLNHAFASRKFRASAGPTGVSTDSGWN